MFTILKEQISIFEKEILLKTQAIESSLSAIVLMSLEGDIVSINTSFLKMFGFNNKNEFLRRHASSFWDKQIDATEITKIVRETGYWFGELTVKKKDGSNVILLVSTNLIRDNSNEPIAMMASFVDITATKKAHDLIKRKLEIEEMLASVSSMFVSSKDLDFCITYALEKICRLCGCSRGNVFSLKNDGTRISNTHEYCMEGIAPQKDNLQDLPSNMFPVWMEKLYNGESVYIKDISALPEEASAEKEFLEMKDIKSLIAFPYYMNSEIAGFIVLENALNIAEWEKEDIEILRMSAHLIGSNLERKKAENAL